MEIDLFSVISDFNEAQDMFYIEFSEDLAQAAEVAETMGYFSFKAVFQEWHDRFNQVIENEFTEVESILDEIPEWPI